MACLVSVIIPVYNAAKYLRDTINSVLDQTYNNFELILVNDGSTDDSERVIFEYIDPRIKYLKKLNGGVSTARNMGIQNANGTYIAFLDADDVWLPNNLEKKVNLAESAGLDWVFSDMYEVNEKLENRVYASKGRDIDFLNEILLWNGEVIPGPASNLVLHKRCFINGLLFDPIFSTAADQDFTLYLSAQYVGQRIAEPLWLYRQISVSMSRNIAVMEKDHIGVYKKAAHNGLFKSFWFRQKCFANLYFILAGSWWVNGNNKLRGCFFLFKALYIYPPTILRLIKKISN
jgi:glycosyltransferase involved in cell wall biosynthesis